MAIYKKKCLLILDGVSKGMKVDEIVSRFESLVPHFKQPSFTVLITRIDYFENPIGLYLKVLEMEPLSAAKIFSLLNEQIRNLDFKGLFEGIYKESEGT